MTTTAQRSAGDWARLLGLVVIWGTAFLFIDLSVETIPPATLVTARVGIAAIVLLIAVRFRGLALPGPGALWLRFLLLACVGNAIPFFLWSRIWRTLHGTWRLLGGSLHSTCQFLGQNIPRPCTDAGTWRTHHD